MLVLVLDTSTPAVTAALADVTPTGHTVTAELRTVDGRAHGELMAPEIDEALRKSGASVRDLVAIVAGTGPGPFTGLRVGLVTAASMGQALGIPTYGVCSLDAIGGVPGQVTLAATDARRREVYWAIYDQAGTRVEGPHVDLPDVVAAKTVAVAVGDGALKYADRLGVKVLDEPRYPVVDTFVRLAAERILAGAPSEPLTPLYLRRPDAVAAGGHKSVLP
ncbi:tRNA (adenosine(37)-N6)-threonylcarbamoyltransferase complex dimerization subunit type 1 TsaB [Asanoa ishikariensis]|uniref:tRNA threonylcarbamoyl adenosine modification protein YeaZ n=1 Tax=Asanoa ishikariensis TaxID=137265 RepID=A0A1H3M393_9ACTN|nr:tRNA (adenosine(37)-N6)-threonylcarbamoyltransferase complex dimerization subunit type 1 TsaB [Asanoa ishikariensis]GIF65847.1 tRNA (adenosine(37)-N6)-threonylcarbamoyltransferase complex dimerization subunit type 1 TsaB [Asanoa ishikariensis]SDY70495.1 tRNA threonylcarbamoyl adenosine modification protein YeaZ [Asanoa ishikariensis]